MFERTSGQSGSKTFPRYVIVGVYLCQDIQENLSKFTTDVELQRIHLTVINSCVDVPIQN